MTIKEFEQKYPDSPVISFLEKRPIAALITAIFIFTVITKIF